MCARPSLSYWPTPRTCWSQPSSPIRDPPELAVSPVSSHAHLVQEPPRTSEVQGEALSQHLRKEKMPASGFLTMHIGMYTHRHTQVHIYACTTHAHRHTQVQTHPHTDTSMRTHTHIHAHKSIIRLRPASWASSSSQAAGSAGYVGRRGEAQAGRTRPLRLAAG